MGLLDELYALTLEEADSTDVQITVKTGIMATMEISETDDDDRIRSKEKINVLVSNEYGGAVAWVQKSTFSDGGSTQIVTHEGYVDSVNPILTGKGINAECRVTLTPVRELSPDLRAYLGSVRNGLFACCTSSGTKKNGGNNCSITCCNASCSDSTCNGCSCSAL